MGEQHVPVVVAVVLALWAAAVAVLVALTRTAAAGSALQSRLFRQWQGRQDAGSTPAAPAAAGRRRSSTGSSETS
jgi:hypothetical protein